MSYYFINDDLSNNVDLTNDIVYSDIVGDNIDKYRTSYVVKDDVKPLSNRIDNHIDNHMTSKHQRVKKEQPVNKEHIVNKFKLPEYKYNYKMFIILAIIILVFIYYATKKKVVPNLTDDLDNYICIPESEMFAIFTKGDKFTHSSGW